MYANEQVDLEELMYNIRQNISMGCDSKWPDIFKLVRTIGIDKRTASRIKTSMNIGCIKLLDEHA